MSEPQDSRRDQPDNPGSAPAGASGHAPLFAVDLPLKQRNGLPLAAWAVPTLIVLVLAGALVIIARKKPVAVPSTLQPADAYAASLPLTQFAMSQSENLSGGTLTYLDGRIGNTGNRTVNSVTVQVVFQNDEAMAPRIDTEPLMLVRTRQPYIDTEPVSAAPLKPGDTLQFRLTFETVPGDWDRQMPVVRVIQTGMK